jgi:SAM-dependent methyltransferase
MERSEYQTLYEQEERFWWYRGMHRLVLRQITPLLTALGCSREGGARVLDAGCGTGGMLARLYERGRPFGIDFHPDALRLARRRGPFPLCRGSVTRLPYRGGSFDAAVSLDVLYHRGVESDLDALREVRRCLRPGGMLVLNLPAYESLRSSHDAVIHTARRYRRDALRRLLGEAGFETVRLTYWNTLLFPGLALVRLLRARRGGRTPEQSDVRPLPAPLNELLAAVLGTERAWLAKGDLPFGLSLLAVARNPGASA